MKTITATPPTKRAYSRELFRAVSRNSNRLTGASDRRFACSISLLGSAFICLIVFAFTASAQTAPTEIGPVAECPANKVCISREAAIKAVETSKERDALQEQLKAEKQAVEDMRKELNEMRVKFAAASGEMSGLKQNAVQDRAIIEILLKSQKKKCLPFSVCIGG